MYQVKAVQGENQRRKGPCRKRAERQTVEKVKKRKQKHRHGFLNQDEMYRPKEDLLVEEQANLAALISNISKLDYQYQ